jgi:hypothetical protein
MDDKQKISAILTVILTALVALLAVFGYDVKVIQPRETNLSEVAQALSAPATVLPAIAQRGITNFNDLQVDGVTTTGGVTVGGPLIQGSKAVTLTAGLQIAPAYSMYLLSSTGAVSMTVAVPTAPGQVLYLYGDDANTITINDTNIRSTDGNAVTTGQYDIVEFMSSGAEWIHVAKSADS